MNMLLTDPQLLAKYRGKSFSRANDFRKELIVDSFLERLES
jgi:hypothetical protein